MPGLLGKHYAQMVAWLQEDKQQNEVLHQEIKQLEEALEQEEICQQQRKKEAEAPGTVLPEVVEAQLERDVLARRRGFIYWLQRVSPWVPCALRPAPGQQVGWTGHLLQPAGLTGCWGAAGRLWALQLGSAQRRFSLRRGVFPGWWTPISHPA
ncbi:uncharacterized protein LOC142073637 [Calonectris borealis]|uniref:uncharacterized protein LOC142073637 n=1 Tax=Calonectris borealis TaxID=1323832 RepID=UPI003F4C2020